MAMGLAVERTANTGHLAYLGAGCGGVGRPAEDARSTTGRDRGGRGGGRGRGGAGGRVWGRILGTGR